MVDESFSALPTGEPESFSLHEWLKKEGIEEVPPIEVNFSFGAHVSKKNARRFKRDIQRSEIVMVEAYGWGPGEADILSKVSKGEIDPHQIVASGTQGKLEDFWQEVFRMTHGRNILLFPLDMPNHHPQYQRVTKTLNELGALGARLGQSPAPALETVQKEFDDIMVRTGKDDAVRESASVTLFRTAIKTALIADEKLQKRDKLRVLVIYGGLHEPLQGHLQHKHPDIQVSGSVRPGLLKFSYGAQNLQKIRSQEGTTPELQRKALLDFLVGALYKNVVEKITNSHDDEAAAFYMQQVVDLFSKKEWEEYYNDYIVTGNKDGPAVLSTALKTNGLPVDTDPKRIQAWYKRFEKTIRA